MPDRDRSRSDARQQGGRARLRQLADAAADALAPVPHPLIFTVGLVSMASLALLDVVTGPELSFSIFYLAPIALVSWGTTPRLGLVMCMVGAATWFLADRASGTEYSHATIPYWNTLVRLGFFVIISLLISAFQEAHRHEQELSRTDSLTGVANSRAFLDAAETELARARRYRHRLSVAYIDLDGFKLVNDRLGHSAGDEVLRTVAMEIRTGVRSTDVVGRLGGDEFAILFPETGGEAASAAIEQVRRRLGRAMEGAPIPVTLSIGVVTCEIPPASADELIRAADRLMYEVKAKGKDEVALTVLGREATLTHGLLAGDEPDASPAT